MNQSLVGIWYEKSNQKLLFNSLVIAFGFLFLVLATQIKFFLPFTPVPVTGQTFAVLIIAFCFGPLRGLSTFGLYLSAGLLNLPVFALPQSSILLGPTFGYLVGMGLSILVIGFFINKGLGKSFISKLVIGSLGMFLVFLFGCIGLSFFVPSNQLLMAGVLPFLPGALVKLVLAAGTSQSLYKFLQFDK